MPLIIDTFREKGVNHEIMDESTFAISFLSRYAFHCSVDKKRSMFWFQFKNFSVDISFCKKEDLARQLDDEWTKFAWIGGFKFLTKKEEIKAYIEKHRLITRLTQEEKNSLRFLLEDL